MNASASSVGGELDAVEKNPSPVSGLKPLGNSASRFDAKRNLPTTAFSDATKMLYEFGSASQTALALGRKHRLTQSCICSEVV